MTPKRMKQRGIKQGDKWPAKEVGTVCALGSQHTLLTTLSTIVMLGQVGKNNLGDIALDDISLTFGSCPKGDNNQIQSWSLQRRVIKTFPLKMTMAAVASLVLFTTYRCQIIYRQYKQLQDTTKCFSGVYTQK
uniref:MAM domain-containing protein n=1 Tax=Timema cristinae TaxID=61476 RepID=A0A7R9H9K7_TIMCR|nr:unnamed protein product [Timema cristinae]